MSHDKESLRASPQRLDHDHNLPDLTCITSVELSVAIFSRASGVLPEHTSRISTESNCIFRLNEYVLSYIKFHC